MKCYIKSWAAFATVAAYDLVSWDVVLDSLDDSPGSCTVVGSAPRSYAGSWAILDGAPYLIDAVTPQGDSSILTLLPPTEAFSRPLIYTPPTPGGTVGSYLAQLLSLWVSEPDGVYSCPYLQVSDSDTTAFVPPQTDDGGLFRLPDYVMSVRAAYGVTPEWSLTEGGLLCTIRKRAPADLAVVFNDGHSQLISAAYSRKGAAKLTLLQGEERMDFYLSEDGAVSSTVPARRAEGSWEVQTISLRDVPADRAAAIFAKNSESHKVEFWSDREIAVGDRIRLRLYGELLTSVLACKSRSSKDSRIRYRSGELATTASEKLRRL